MDNFNYYFGRFLLMEEAAAKHREEGINPRPEYGQAARMALCAIEHCHPGDERRINHLAVKALERFFDAGEYDLVVENGREFLTSEALPLTEFSLERVNILVLLAQQRLASVLE